MNHPAPTHIIKATLSSRYIIPLAILIGIVIAAAAQTELAHYTSTQLHYDQPYFTFYLTHSTFSLIFPIHLLVLKIVRPGIPVKSYLESLKHVIADQLGGSASESESRSVHGLASRLTSVGWRSIWRSWTIRVLWLTLLVSVPALSWFVAMSYTTSMDVTSIYATSSFHAYFFSMLLMRTPLSRLTIGSICLAFAGVVSITLAGNGSSARNDENGDGNLAGGYLVENGVAGPSNRFFGDVVMMLGAIVLGLYEVVYKLVLPEGHGGVPVKETSAAGYNPLPSHIQDHSSTTPPDSRPLTPNLSTEDDHPRGRPTSPSTATATTSIPLTPSNRRASSVPLLSSSNRPTTPQFRPSTYRHELVHLPTALHANFLTSCLGLATLLVLWIPVVGLHVAGIESFRWPGSQSRAWEIWTGLEVVAWGGALYNAGLMVLIGIWGPTTSSVANLLTIGLVAVIDALWLGEIPNLQTLIGVGMICVGFGVLLWEGEG